MASDYGLNFGFRRSDETMATREGRNKTPKTGAALRQGIAVTLDPANLGYLKVAAANEVPVSGLHGLLVQEEAHIGSIFTAAPFGGHDSLDVGLCKLDQLSVMWAGVGTKVWFRNTLAYDRASRHRDAVEMADLTGVAIKDGLAWDGAKWIKAGAGLAWLSVTNVSADGNYAEAVSTF